VEKFWFLEVQVGFVPENSTTREVCTSLNTQNTTAFSGVEITPPCKYFDKIRIRRPT
jgi:hypothetical protein